MNVPLIILVFLGLSIYGIFVMKREMLINKKITVYLIFYCLILFFIGILLHTYNVKGHSLLMLPIIHFVIYRICNFIFFKIYKKQPKNTYKSNDLKLMKDGIFNFLYFILAFTIPFVLIILLKNNFNIKVF